MEYEDFELQIGPRSRNGLLVRVLRSPAGEGETLAHLPEDAGVPADVGGSLFRSVFTGQVAALFQRSLSRVEAPSCGLRIRLRINPRDRTVANLQSLPWELLYREDTEDFLALSRRTPVVRALDVPRPAALRPYEPPLRILAILARDPEGSPLSLEEELKELRKALERNPAIRLEVLDDPDTRTIRDALNRGGFHILHYMGHGVFEPESGEGALLFGSPEGRLPVTGRHLATKIKDFDALRLVVLNACETAIAHGEAPRGPFAGVAAALVLGGVPAVVAMQSAIGDAHAVAFTSAFYESLVAGVPVEEAVTEGRQAIHSLEPDESSWAIPVLFLRAAVGDLFAPTGTTEAASMPAPLPVTPPGRRMAAGRFSAAAIVLVVLGIATAGLVERWERQIRRPDAEVTTRLPGPAEPARSVKPAVKEAPVSNKESLRPSAPSPAPLFEITGNAPGGLRTALRQETESLSRALSGRTVQVTVESRSLAPFSEGGIPMVSCRILGNASLREGSASIDLGPVSGVGAQIDDHFACEEAARKLARSVVQKLAPYLQEGPK